MQRRGRRGGGGEMRRYSNYCCSVRLYIHQLLNFTVLASRLISPDLPLFLQLGKAEKSKIFGDGGGGGCGG